MNDFDDFKPAPMPVDPLKGGKHIIALKGALHSESELATLQAAQKTYADGQEAQKHFNYLSGSKRYFQHLEDIAKAGMGTIHESDARSEQSFIEADIVRMEAAKVACRNASNSVLDLVRRIANDAAMIFEAFAADHAKTEAETYAEFGLPSPGPSKLTLHLHKMAVQARTRVPKEPAQYGCAPSPADMLPYLEL